MNIRSLARKPFFDFYFIGPIMPHILRIAVSDALTFSPEVDTSGPRGHFNFNKFRKLKINSGLSKHFKTIKEIKEEGNHITERLSISDLIQIGGASAVEYCGGPYIELKVGRIDIDNDHSAADHTNFPELEMNAAEIRERYSKLGFSDDLIVALFGYRTLGFLSNNDNHREERWTRNPWTFDNNYYEELVDKKSPYAKTSSDLALVSDESLRHWVEVYAKNQDDFFEKFVLAYQKMSELGAKDLLEENTSYLKEYY
jgi:catalase (peroxidase I)